ncbi:MAG: hypothetical protein AAF992_09840 [Bacteroidota bacterium]
MRQHLYILVGFVILSCSINTGNNEWKTIEIGDYQFDFPSDFKLAKERGIDSYVGKIKGDSLWLAFDFGYYSSSFAKTPEELLKEESWRWEAAYQFMENGVTYDNKNYPKIETLSIRPADSQDSSYERGVDYIATCIYEDTTFEYPIFIPAETEEVTFKIDTIGNSFRKIVIASDPKKGITGIYLRDLDGFNESINSYLALSMSTSNLTETQQELVLKIFDTGRLIREE